MSTLGAASQQHEQEQENFGAVPAGTYKVAIEDCQMKTPKNGGKDYLNVQFTIVSDKFQNRKFFHVYNFNHANDVPRKIGRGEFASLAVAAGAPADTNLEDVLSDNIKPLSLLENTGRVLFVKVNKKNETYEGESRPVNKINAYYSLTNETGKVNFQKTIDHIEAKGSYTNGAASAPLADSSLTSGDIPF